MGQMTHRRMAWTACVVTISALGLSGILAEGCGGDDSTNPTTGGGSGGSAGKGGSTSAGGGGAGRNCAGPGGSGASAGAGGSARGDSGMDAPIDAQAACAATINTGSTCSDKCICDNCAT